MSGMPGPEFFLLVIDDREGCPYSGRGEGAGGMVRCLPGKGVLFFLPEKTPDGMIAIRGFV